MLIIYYFNTFLVKIIIKHWSLKVEKNKYIGN